MPRFLLLALTVMMMTGTLAASEPEAGYESLFNGQDLTGWEGAGRPAETCWKVEDGAIVCTGERGPWLRSIKEYADFNLRLEYQVADGGNSGIYVRVPKNGNHHRKNEQEPPAGFEVQILDDAAEKHRKLKDHQYSGSVYDIAGPTQHVSKPAGEWNTLEINCRGQHVATIHNGVKIVEVTPETHPPITLRNESGHLGLQNHSSIVRFRNLRIGPAVQSRPVTP
ncbi:MAG: 3-keto-disaccharide hydrolase [Planctomycetaceae bacterium]